MILSPHEIEILSEALLHFKVALKVEVSHSSDDEHMKRVETLKHEIDALSERLITEQLT